MKRVDTGDGVLVLTDMFGGTPANLALTFLDEKLEVVTGVNLPMILKLATVRAEASASTLPPSSSPATDRRTSPSRPSSSAPAPERAGRESPRPSAVGSP